MIHFNVDAINGGLILPNHCLCFTNNRHTFLRSIKKNSEFIDQMSERFVFTIKNNNIDNNNAVSRVCTAPWLPELFSKAVCSLDSINIP